jgi:hypothetical protein
MIYNYVSLRYKWPIKSGSGDKGFSDGLRPQIWQIDA